MVREGERSIGLGCLATYELPRHGGGEYTHLSIIIPFLLFTMGRFAAYFALFFFLFCFTLLSWRGGLYSVRGKLSLALPFFLLYYHSCRMLAICLG